MSFSREDTATQDDADSGSDDEGSVTSTVYYGQEPFDTYAPKATALLSEIFHSIAPIEIERMKGGSYNRIIGATLNSGEKYVIRIPRFPEPTILEVADQVAAIRYVAHHSTIAVPDVLHFDTTDNNAIGSPYMVQMRLDGQPLHHLMDDLSIDDRKVAAIQMASMCSQLSGMTFPSGGVIRAEDYSEGRGIRLTGPLNSRMTLDGTPHYPLTNTLSFLQGCFDEHISETLRRDPCNLSTPRLRRLKLAADLVSTQQQFSNRFSMLHVDLEPRNILARRDDLDNFVITALLDLDNAMAALIEVAWTLPHWLWSWNDDDDDNPMDPDAEPSDKDLQEVKRIFEAEIERLVPGYKSVWRGGREVRELFYFAVHGLRSSEDLHRLDRFLGPLGVP